MSCANTAEPIKTFFQMWTWVCPTKHVLQGGAHWRNLANITERSMGGGKVACLPDYFDHLFGLYKCIFWTGTN